MISLEKSNEDMKELNDAVERIDRREVWKSGLMSGWRSEGRSE